MLYAAYEVAKKKKIPVHVGNVMSSDIFYNYEKDAWKKWQALGVLAVDLEAYALFATASSLNNKALAIMTVSDSLVTKQETTPEEREKHFLEMMEIALEIA